MKNAEARPLVRQIRSAHEFDRLIEKHSSSTGLPIIADFYSDGCGPCRQMAPIFKKYAKKYADKAVFIKIDTNQIHEVSSRYSVRSIPTFIAFHNGKKVNEFSGAGEGQLRQMTDSAIDRAQYENVKLTLEDLVTYYTTKDESKTLESVQGVHTKCVEMIKNNKNKECMGAAAQKLAKNLKKKYKEAPPLQPRFTPEDQASSNPDNKNENDASKNSSKNKDTASDKPNLHLASIESLQEELERRLEAEQEAKDDDSDTDYAEFQHGWSKSDFPERVTIIGGGPAGMSAAIYAARAGLNPVVIAPPMGGQLQGKGVDVENYPGMINVSGPAVVSSMRTQAASFGAVFVAESVDSIDVTKRPFVVNIIGSTGDNNSTNNNNANNNIHIETHTIIVATGAESNWLNIKGEYDMRGGGVSTCATCDGHFFKDTNVVVVGGGDTAMEDALVLARTSKHVTVVHRRDSFRASNILSDRVMNHPSISIRWNTTVQEILGTDSDDGKKLVTGVVLVEKSASPGETTTISCSAVFVAIGHTPTTGFLEGVVEFDPHHAGYVKTYSMSTKTSLPGIYAAGDVADSVYRQAITSAGSGAAAALDAERWLSEEGLGNEADEFEAELLRELMEDMPSSSSASNVYDDVGVSTKGYKESLGVEL